MSHKVWPVAQSAPVLMVCAPRRARRGLVLAGSSGCTSRLEHWTIPTEGWWVIQQLAHKHRHDQWRRRSVGGRALSARRLYYPCVLFNRTWMLPYSHQTWMTPPGTAHYMVFNVARAVSDSGLGLSKQCMDDTSTSRGSVSPSYWHCWRTSPHFF